MKNPRLEWLIWLRFYLAISHEFIWGWKSQSGKWCTGIKANYVYCIPCTDTLQWIKWSMLLLVSGSWALTVSGRRARASTLHDSCQVHQDIATPISISQHSQTKSCILTQTSHLITLNTIWFYVCIESVSIDWIKYRLYELQTQTLNG